MTLSTILILYVVGMVLNFVFLPMLVNVDDGNDLVLSSLFFPIFWIAATLDFFSALGEKYLKYLEARNEK